MKIKKIFYIIIPALTLLLFFSFNVACTGKSEEAEEEAVIEEGKTALVEEKEVIGETESISKEEEALDESEPELIPPSSYQAESLPNGIIFGNVSIALTKIERKQDYHNPQIDNVMFCFTLRKIKTLEEPDFELFFEVIDDHENIYDKNNMNRFYGCPGSGEIKIGPNLGRQYSDFCPDADINIDKAPIGFTWVVCLRSFKIPHTAPLTKLKIYYSTRTLEEELTTIDLSTFKPIEVKDFYSHLKEQDCLFLPYKIDIDKYFSMTIHKIKKGQEYLIIPITFKNDDYNPSHYSLRGMGIQNINGEILWGYYLGDEGALVPTHKGFATTIPELSQKTIEIYIQKMEEEGMPKAILFYSLPGKTSDNIIILKISPENFE